MVVGKYSVSITRIPWWIFWPGWGISSLFCFSGFIFCSLVWVGWPSGCGLVLLPPLFSFWVPFCILPVYFLEPFGCSFSIYLLFIDQKKKNYSRFREKEAENLFALYLLCSDQTHFLCCS